jgi:hypothetical protein
MYKYKIFYKAGKDNVEADCLSRNPIETADQTYKNDLNEISKPEINKAINLICKNKIKHHQSNILLNLKNHQTQQLDLQKIKQHQSESMMKENLKKTILIDDILYKQKKNRKLIYIPKTLVCELIDTFHKEFGHIGTKQMAMLISRNYYFFNSNKLIKEFVDACETCVLNKSRCQKALGQLAQLGPATKPGEIIAIDTVGGFSNKSNHKYLHIAIDAFTRYVWITTSKTQTAKDFVNLIHKVKQNCKVELVLCDLYTGINSGDFKNYLKAENIKNIFTTPDAAQSNGLCERANQTLSNLIRCVLFDKHYQIAWTTVAHQVVDNYNQTPHSVTKYPPAYLMHLPLRSLAFNENNYEPVELAAINALENSQQYHKVNKKYYDAKRENFSFEEGDLVYIKKQKQNIDQKTRTKIQRAVQSHKKDICSNLRSTNFRK